MTHEEWLAHQFESHRLHLRAEAYRMLGSLDEVDDVVQETWLRVSRAGTDEVENLGGRRWPGSTVLGAASSLAQRTAPWESVQSGPPTYR